MSFFFKRNENKKESSFWDSVGVFVGIGALAGAAYYLASTSEEPTRAASNYTSGSNNNFRPSEEPTPGTSHSTSGASGSNNYRGESTTTNNFRNRVRSLDVCAICMNEVYESAEENGDFQPRDLPCNHRFHTTCIKLWLSMQKPWCPVCRAKVDE